MMESMDFYKLFVNYWGNKASMVRFSKEQKTIQCTLYDSFSLRCGLDGNNDTFEGGIITADDKIVSQYLGKRLSLNNDSKSILENFEKIDHYCRMRLPDKFLAEYESAADNRQ